MKTGMCSVTKELKAGPEIHRLNSELKAANQNLEAFNYSVSHDLRAPLRHILGYVDILKATAGQTLDEKNRQNLQIIAEAAAQMGEMLEALLEFSRMGRTKMLCKRVNLTALVKEVRLELHCQARGREIDWQIEKLPEVHVDPLMLRQVIFNLLSNSIKFTRTRSKAKIEIMTTNSGGEAIISIRDNGVGFDMDYAKKLFGVFQRFHPTSEFEGTGTGLANVRLIINRHGGRTWAQGKVNGGATFYFSIPKRTKAES